MRRSKTRSGLNAITDPAVYKQLEELFSQASELPEADQAAFLRDKCGSDTDLLRLVQNLLQQDREGIIEPQLAADSSKQAFAKTSADEPYLITRLLSR